MAQDVLVAQAQDPATPLATLQQLAQDYPGLRPAIAANPSTYPALLEWLGDLGDPAVDAALATRGGAAVSAVTGTVLPPSVAPAAQAPQSGSAPGTAPMGSATATSSWPVADDGVFGVGTAQPGGPESGQGSSRNRTFMWVAIAVCVGIVALLAGWFLGAMGTPEAGPTAEPVATTAAPSDPAAGVPTRDPSTPSPSPTPSATAAIVAPAPAGAQEMASFTAPSGNITCVLGETSVSCTINTYSFAATGPSCSGTSVPFTASVGTSGSASGACTSGFSTSGAVLQYGASAKNDSFACTVAEDGITCWNQRSGQGFLIRREGATAQTF